jgi:thiol:disulfide interchange protein DsbC
VGALPEGGMIVFGKPNLAHTITVFTDVDCQWCRQLHSQIDEYNKLGIRVRYLAYPRSGPDTESWTKAEAVWCAKDRNAALTRAKLGKSVDSSACAAPVAQHYALGRQMELSGTPGLILESGELVPGYMPPKSLLEAIEAEAARAGEAQQQD